MPLQHLPGGTATSACRHLALPSSLLALFPQPLCAVNLRHHRQHLQQHCLPARSAPVAHMQPLCAVDRGHHRQHLQQQQGQPGLRPLSRWLLWQLGQQHGAGHFCHHHRQRSLRQQRLDLHQQQRSDLPVGEQMRLTGLLWVCQPVQAAGLLLRSLPSKLRRPGNKSTVYVGLRVPRSQLCLCSSCLPEVQCKRTTWQH